MDSVQVQELRTGTRYGLDILQTSDKKVKTKHEKVFEANLLRLKKLQGKNW